MNLDEVLPSLNRFGKLFEAYEIMTVKGFRRSPTDLPQPVTIDIYDAGTRAAPQYRYIVSVASASACVIWGHYAGTLDAAIASVPWADLDQLPDTLSAIAPPSPPRREINPIAAADIENTLRRLEGEDEASR
jgi:hypothetical protein